MRAVLVALWSVLVGVQPALAARVWNSKLVVNGSPKTVAVIGEDRPALLLPKCRCVVGQFSLAKGGETATHFTGKLDDIAFNHTRSGKAVTSLAVRIRKTRDVMSVHTNHRVALHGILRGGGQLILREVKGGEHEVVGYSTGPIDELFVAYRSFRALDDRPPALTAPTPVIDPAADARSLAKLINDYRASMKLPRIAISRKLTKVAEAHVHDLGANTPDRETCNMHSWSQQKQWTGCCYDGSKAAMKCMWVKPKEIAGYAGHGYEIAANATGITPSRALELWQKSEPHHVIMINRGKWKAPWRAMGVAISGDYAVAWFGEDADK
jgi:hypothetical protein